jgi:hypothetical protein
MQPIAGRPLTNWSKQLVNTSKIRSEHREAIVAVVKKRESSMSTGIGFGIGIPHASTDLIQEVVGALGRSKKGIEFDALDNQPVNLVVLFLVPQGQFQKHLTHFGQHRQTAPCQRIPPGTGTSPRRGRDVRDHQKVFRAK